jgi:hypothetical protein
MIFLSVATLLMAIALAWLIIHDLRHGRTGILNFKIDRRSNQLGYWSMIMTWILALAFCLLYSLYAYFAYQYPPLCNGSGSCTITVKVDPQ